LAVSNLAVEVLPILPPKFLANLALPLIASGTTLVCEFWLVQDFSDPGSMSVRRELADFLLSHGNIWTALSSL